MNKPIPCSNEFEDNVTQCESWLHLQSLSSNTEQLFNETKQRLVEDPNSLWQFGFEKIHVDFSKQLMTEQVFSTLQKLANERQLQKKIHDFFQAKIVNSTENRAAAHWLLRGDHFRDINHQHLWSDEVEKSLLKMELLVEKLTQGHWRGYSGKSIKDIVNLGVGGSDLGPLMACHALENPIIKEETKVNVHFASSIDGSQLAVLLSQLNPETTLFLLASKSFTTIDTFSNAETAKRWFARYCSNEKLIIQQHFIGISTSIEKMDNWGLPKSNQLLFWDWVGGRFSLWSVIGLPIALKIGMEGFKQMLKGAYEMDKHFLNEPFSSNLPVILGLIGIWNVNFLNIKQHAVLPYDGRLKFFPQYLQQLEMESNGKSIDLLGRRVDYSTCPVIWGEVGPNAQHAFYQLLHQGTQQVSSDFVAILNRYDEIEEQSSKQSLKHQHLLGLANCFAQSRVLLFGDDAIENTQNRPLYKTHNGGQPSSTILLDELSPYTLGLLLALYEHKVFVQSVIWNINPFDQWGVELGKVIAKETLELLNHHNLLANSFLDSSTLQMINSFHQKVK